MSQSICVRNEAQAASQRWWWWGVSGGGRGHAGMAGAAFLELLGKNTKGTAFLWEQALMWPFPLFIERVLSSLHCSPFPLPQKKPAKSNPCRCMRSQEGQ